MTNDANAIILLFTSKRAAWSCHCQMVNHTSSAQNRLGPFSKRTSFAIKYLGVVVGQPLSQKNLASLLRKSPGFFAPLLQTEISYNSFVLLSYRFSCLRKADQLLDSTVGLRTSM